MKYIVNVSDKYIKYILNYVYIYYFKINLYYKYLFFIIESIVSFSTLLNQEIKNARFYFKTYNCILQQKNYNKKTKKICKFKTNKYIKSYKVCYKLNLVLLL